MAELTTRDKLRDAAMQLYAERGVFHVSLAEIVRAAGQRNASAVHYHFGSRDQILLEILQPCAAAVRARRLSLLDDARSAPGLRPLAEAMVRPVIELARLGWRERAYLRIGLDIADRPDEVGADVLELLNDTGARETLELLASRCGEVPADVLRWRIGICVGIVARAVAEGGEPYGWPDEAFTSHLIDVYLGVLAAPTSTQ